MEAVIYRKKLLYFSWSIIMIFILLFGFCILGLYGMFEYKNIYGGIKINGIDVGGMTKEEAYETVSRKLKNDVYNSIIEVKYKNKTFPIYLDSLELKTNIEEVIENAYNVGRKGNMIERYSQIISILKNGGNHNIELKFNEQKLKDVLNSIASQVNQGAKETELIIEQERVLLVGGKSGKGIDIDESMNIIKSKIYLYDFSPIEINLKELKPKKFNREEMFEKLNIEPKDAYPEVNNGKVNIIPEKLGMMIGRNEFEKICDDVEKNEGVQKIVPVKFIEAKLNSQDISNRLFTDILGTQDTTFDNDGARNINIQVAARALNGYILGPGEIFSFNNVVGDSTPEKGYKQAGVYGLNGVTMGYGGGICQCVSTLFNAVLKADLDVVERVCHKYRVYYYPAGFDATVSYGSIDFKFKNNTKWPVKIVTYPTSTSLSISLIGTKEDYDKTVDYYTVTTSGDPETAGSVDTYKRVYKNGKLVEDKKIFSSNYEYCPPH